MMGGRKEIFWPVWAIVWVAMTTLFVVVERGEEPFLDFAPWWLRIITNAICVLIVATYIWRGRRET